MPQNENSFLDDLEQIRTRLMPVFDEVDAIREREGKLTRDIEKIQTDVLKIVHDIDEIRDRERMADQL